MTRLLVVSNRLPVVIDREDDGFAVREGAGGLVTAIKPLLSRVGGAWVGFGGMFDDERDRRWEKKLADLGDSILYHPVTPCRKLYDSYYAQYANQELWPRFHSMNGKLSRSATRHWPAYVAMNHHFAERTCEVANPGDLIWVQDYHLMLLPQILREEQPDCPVGHFLHIPFPPADVMARQPQAEEVMAGVLGADLLGFHIPAYMDHFIDTAEQIVGAGVLARETARAVLEFNGREVRLGAFPIGIQPSQLERAADPSPVQQKLGAVADTLILSMDRLDYTKAIPPRLKAYRMLLDSYPGYRENVSLVQMLDLSRKDIPAYQEEKAEVEATVEDIRSRYHSWQAIRLFAERWQRTHVAALMQMSKVCLVTPRCDGMNLVAKEYVSAAPSDGVLVLSRQAGAAWQFGKHALMVDGESPLSILRGLRTALEMPPDERRARMRELKKNVRQQDVFWWARQFMDALQPHEPLVEDESLSGSH